MAKGKKHGKKDQGGKGRRRGGHKFKASDTGNLESQLRDLNLCTKDISGDGNCLFRALSDQYHGYDTEHATIRHEICEFLRENEEEYQFFVEDDQSLDHHLTCMAQDGTYGGNMELAAFARMRQVDIKVYQPGLIYIIRGINETEASEQILHIAYHSWEHYSSVRNVDGPFSGLPEVKVQESQAKQENEEEDGDDLLLDSKEKAVLAACPDTSIRKIRRLLRKHKGDPDKVIEVLYEIPTDELEEEENKEKDQQTDPSIITTTTTTTTNTTTATESMDTNKSDEKESITPDQQQEKTDDALLSATDPKEPYQKPPNEDNDEKTPLPLEPSSTSSNDNKTSAATDHQNDIDADNEIEESSTPDKPDLEQDNHKPPPKKTKKKMTKRQKKLLQKENRKAKWLEEHNRQGANKDETNAVTTAMKEMYI